MQDESQIQNSAAAPGSPGRAACWLSERRAGGRRGRRAIPRCVLLDRSRNVSTYNFRNRIAQSSYELQAATSTPCLEPTHLQAAIDKYPGGMKPTSSPTRSKADWAWRQQVRNVQGGRTDGQVEVDTPASTPNRCCRQRSIWDLQKRRGQSHVMMAPVNVRSKKKTRNRR